MPVIARKGKKVTADGVPLRGLPLATVRGNIVVFHTEKASIMPAGFTLAYFMDSDESARAMKAGELAYKYVHDRLRFSWDSAPIRDVWKKENDKGQEHILGVVQGIVDDSEIYVDKMTVRPGYKRQTINTKLIQALQATFPNRPVHFSGPTEDGSKFIKSFTGADWKPAHGEKAEF